ncbi:YceI family protein [Polaribacter sp. Hel1_85]|uniref:YceI family protein n=1 Tax=Polaribacter sp. Hel1_85 TaxID=1250005 RepID=UPI00052C70F1|nr:YceI family protein [Polaribacter sp. Hel1_85]KGL63941.1 YceI family protein [Polaribacter sp. Hel1_85]
MRKVTSLLIILLTTTSSLLCQQTATNLILDIKLPSSVSVKGTSTLHDWESKVEKTNATININNLDEVAIETIDVKIEATSLKSGKRTMDKITYKALKAEEHPLISFIFKKGEIISENTDFINITLHGDLTIAGVTKNVSVLTRINKLGDTITLIGKYKLKMTDYGIKPPTALLGTIKTGDEITIEFNLKF